MTTTTGSGRTPTSRRLATMLAALALALLSTLAFVAPASAGVSGPAFYVDGELYRTVGTPTDFSHTGAPADSYDVIYAIDGATNVAEAHPGDRDYNGGRWLVHSITVDDFDAALAAVDSDGSGSLDSAEEVEAAIDLGLATDNGVVRSFLCPVIPLPRDA
jgi:hypothetical protein